MKNYLLILLLFVIPTYTLAGECSQRDAYAAETVVDYLDSWNNLNLAYRQFKHCDDGSIAEGFSDAVARLLVDQWANLDEFMILSTRDPAFKKFVLFHINSTLNFDDLQKIKKNSENNCPLNAKEVCNEIAKEVDVTIKNP